MAERPGVLVTRTAPGCFETAERLEAGGFSAIVSPALEIRTLNRSLPPLADISGLIFTSANGVRAFCDQSGEREFTAWCVGPATADSAAEAGFTDIRNADGNADDLASFIIRNAGSGSATLLHVANDAAAGEVVKTLRNAGLDAEFAALYSTRPAERLTREAGEALAAGQVSAVLIHSAKGAAGAAPLLADYGLKRINLVAISQKAAAAIAQLEWKRVVIAGAPNEDALINALRMCYTPD